MDFFTKNERVRSYSIYEHDTTLKIAFGATFFLADFNTGPPISRSIRQKKVEPATYYERKTRFWETCLQLSAGKTHYYLQCTTWKDKKYVLFLSNDKVGRSDDLTGQRHVRGKRTHNTIGAPQAQANYVANYKAVDRN